MNTPMVASPTKNWVFAVSMPFEEGRFRVSVRDLPEVVTSGVTEAEGIAQALDAIEVSLAYRLKRGEPLPRRTPVQDGEYAISISARLAAKAAVVEAWRDAGITKQDLARRMGRNEVEVRRILDPDYGTKLEQLDEAAKALGMRFTIALAPATARW